MTRPYWFVLLYLLSEIAISTFLRSRNQSSATDRGSFRMIWLVVNISVIAAMFAYVHLRVASFAPSEAAYWIGVVIFFGGLLLRWYSIYYLGRFFTVQIAVMHDHKIIDTGPYKHIRHPSYLGALTAFFGLGLCLQNIATLLLLVVPPAAVFFYRIRLEEAALLSGLGEAYAGYMRRTKRLLPFLY